jgi:hypothetical protein
MGKSRSSSFQLLKSKPHMKQLLQSNGGQHAGLTGF